MPTPDLSRLVAQLNQTDLQQKSPPLYQVIKQLIQNIKDIQDSITAQIVGPVGPVSNIANQNFLTSANNTPILPNSRQLLAGSNVVFNDAVFGERTISVTLGPGVSGIWVPLTDGVLPETQIVFDGFGDCIMVFVPQ